MRLFVAIAITAEVAANISAITQKLADTRADVRWVNAANYHVTVKFLGEVEDQRVEELKARLKRAAGEVPVFEMEVEGLGRLPEKGPARVIVAHLISPDQRIVKLHRLIDSAVGGMGLPMDTRVLVPHLTLGRVRTNHGMNRLLRLMEKHAKDYFGSFKVERVVLMRSELGAGTGGGPQYAEVMMAELGRGEGGSRKFC